jgi:hypothetical protein
MKSHADVEAGFEDDHCISLRYEENNANTGISAEEHEATYSNEELNLMA